MTLSQNNSAPTTAMGQEQAYLDMLYRLLDEARDRTERALARTHGSGGAGGTFQARIEREVTAAEQARRLAQPAKPRARCTSAGSACATTSTSRGSSTGARPPPIPFTPPPRKTRTA